MAHGARPAGALTNFRRYAFCGRTDVIVLLDREMNCDLDRPANGALEEVRTRTGTCSTRTLSAG